MAAENEHVNPFASPLAEESGPGPDVPSDLGQVEHIRREHLSREATIKSIGLVSYLGAVLIGIVGIGTTVASLSALAAGPANSPELIGRVVGSLFALVLMAGGSWWVGAGLRNFRGSARIWGIVLSVIWLLLSIPAFNLLTLIISICGVWCLVGEKGKYIFSPEYQQVIAATPHVRYKTSKWVWIVLAVLVGILVLLIGVALVNNG